MALNPAQIKNAQFLAQILTQGVFPIQPDIPIDLALNFSGVENIRQYVGTFTPNNDYVIIDAGLIEATSFNFLIAICDKQMNLTVSLPISSFVVAMQRFNFTCWTPSSSPNNWPTGLFIDGRVGPNPGNIPMPQGQTLNYQIITGKATLT